MRFSNFVGAVALLIAIYIIWQIQSVVLLAFTAVVLATAINCFVKLLIRSGIRKRGAAIFVALFSLLLILAVFILIIIPPFVSQVQQSLSLLPQAADKIEVWLMWLQERVPEELVGRIQELGNLTRNLPDLATQLVSNFYSIFSGSLGVLLNLLLVTVITIMLLASPQSYTRLFLAFFPSFYRRRAGKILKKTEKALVGWTKGILFNMLVIAILSGLGLWILGIRLPLANAVFAGLLTFIPNIGPVLSCVPPIALALIEAPWKALAVLILYFLIQQVESNILTPLVMKQQVSLLPAIVLLAQATFAVFFGFIGLFLALPLAVVAKVWIEEVLIKDILSTWGKKRSNDRIKAAKDNANNSASKSDFNVSSHKIALANQSKSEK